MEYGTYTPTKPKDKTFASSTPRRPLLEEGLSDEQKERLSEDNIIIKQHNHTAEGKPSCIICQKKQKLANSHILGRAVCTYIKGLTNGHGATHYFAKSQSAKKKNVPDQSPKTKLDVATNERKSSNTHHLLCENCDNKLGEKIEIHKLTDFSEDNWLNYSYAVMHSFKILAMTYIRQKSLAPSIDWLIFDYMRLTLLDIINDTNSNRTKKPNLWIMNLPLRVQLRKCKCRMSESKHAQHRFTLAEFLYFNSWAHFGEDYIAVTFLRYMYIFSYNNLIVNKPHTPIEIPCNHCGEAFKTERDLRKHIKNQHPEVTEKSENETLERCMDYWNGCSFACGEVFDEFSGTLLENITCKREEPATIIEAINFDTGSINSTLQKEFLDDTNDNRFILAALRKIIENNFQKFISIKEKYIDTIQGSRE